MKESCLTGGAWLSSCAAATMARNCCVLSQYPPRALCHKSITGIAVSNVTGCIRGLCSCNNFQTEQRLRSDHFISSSRLSIPHLSILISYHWSLPCTTAEGPISSNPQDV